MIEMALTEGRRMVCDIYVFPADLFDISGLESYADVDSIERFVLETLSNVQDMEWNLYVNGGLAIMLLAVIHVAGKLGAHLNIKHYDRVKAEYVDHELRWQPVSNGNRKKSCLTLCAARHYGIPEEVIFKEIPSERVMDFEWQEHIASDKLRRYADGHILVYITGLSQALISVLNVLSRYDIAITCMHYDYTSETYFPQSMMP